MRVRPTVLLVLLMNTTGCVFMDNLVHNVCWAPHDHLTDLQFRMRMRQLARVIWIDIEGGDEHGKSKFYARGFEDGFVDYSDRGGSGEPPAMPPHDLIRREIDEIAGPGEIEDWYAGYRHGASEARERNMHDRVVVPIGRPPRTSTSTSSTPTTNEPRREFVPPMPGAVDPKLKGPAN